MKNRILILSFLLLIQVNSISAQQKTSSVQDEFEDTIDVPSKLLSWIKTFNKEINNFFSAEKCDKLKRELGYIRTDLRSYLTLRKKLTDTLERHNYKYEFDPATKKKLNKIWDKMSFRLEKMLPELSTPLQEETSEIIGITQLRLRSNARVFVSKLDYLLDDKKVDRVKFRTESKKTYEDLTQTLQMITRAQVNLEKKAKELSSQ